MYMSRMMKCRWLDDKNKIVHVTETISGMGTITAEVNLQDDTVTIMHTEFVEESMNETRDDRDSILHAAQAWERRQRPPCPRDIRWHEDGMKFETHPESWEWASTVVYNEIGTLYEGYRTEDEKIACSLVYELVRRNTSHGPMFHVCAHNEYDKGEQKYWYMVWVEPV